MTLLPWLGALTLAVWLVILFLFILGYRRLEWLDETGAPRADDPPLPRASIIIPAHNEEGKVEATLRSLLELDYPDYEVILVNDRSEDRTGEIAERVGAEDSRIRVIHVEELPPGWFGKNHAAHQGARAASGEVLLFTDGDVVFEPDALACGVRHLRRAGLDHFSAGPSLRPVRGLMTRACIVAFLVGAYIVARLWSVRDPESSAYFGIGAYTMMRADSYRALGGHERIALCPDEDVQLGRLVKASGMRSDYQMAERLLGVEWCASVREVILSGEKNFFAGTDYRLSAVVGMTLLAFWLLALPFILTPVLALSPDAGLWGTALFAASACACWLVSGATARLTGYPWWCGLPFPIAVAILGYTGWRSTFLTITRGVAWGGPPVPLSELRAKRFMGTGPPTPRA